MVDQTRNAKSNRVTIKDIAREAELSVSTVSRALSNHPRISVATRNLVLDLAEKMGYMPNQLARALVQRKTRLIGLLVFDSRNPFYAELTRSIQDTLEESDYWVVQSNTDDDDAKTESLIKSMIEFGVEGILFASCKLDDPTVERLIDEGFPVVLTNRRLKKNKGDYVVVDNAYGAYLIVNHLIHLGYGRIGIITGPKNLSTSVDRFRGYFEALRDKKLKFDETIVKYGKFFAQETGHKYAKELLLASTPPEAIFCCDDYIALGAMKAVYELGLTIPEDIAIVGFDDAEISSHPLIQLTTVSQDVAEMGRMAAKTIIERIEGSTEPSKRNILEPHLIIRHSCGYQMISGGTGFREPPSSDDYTNFPT